MASVKSCDEGTTVELGDDGSVVSEAVTVETLTDAFISVEVVFLVVVVVGLDSAADEICITTRESIIRTCICMVSGIKHQLSRHTDKLIKFISDALL